ncbi:MAG TPA: hypothetical protein VLK36_11790, partial [Gaiellaceae bacterium]|nr:hypothetical protein [Gaiellaceae bacterium]
ATTTLADDLKAAGSPGTASGAKAKQSLDTLANQMSASADTIKTAASRVESRYLVGFRGVMA